MSIAHARAVSPETNPRLTSPAESARQLAVSIDGLVHSSAPSTDNFLG